MCRGPKDMGCDPTRSIYAHALKEASKNPLPHGAMTVTPTDCFVRALETNDHDKLLELVWNGLAQSMIRAKMDTVSIKGKRYTPLQCAVMAVNRPEIRHAMNYSRTLSTVLQLLRGDEKVELNLPCYPPGETFDIPKLLIVLSIAIPLEPIRPTDRLCELSSVAAVAFRFLSAGNKRFLLNHYMVSSEVLWGWAVATCDNPMYYEHIADSMAENEVALVCGTTSSRSDVRTRLAWSDERLAWSKACMMDVPPGQSGT